MEVVPGVTSFCAVADTMMMPLVAWDEDLVIAPVRKNSDEDLGEILRSHDNIVLMKPSSNKKALRRQSGRIIWRSISCWLRNQVRERNAS